MQDIKGMGVSKACLRFPCGRVEGRDRSDEITVQPQGKEEAVRSETLKGNKDRTVGFRGGDNWQL